MYSTEENRDFLRHGSIRYLDMDRLFDFTPHFFAINSVEAKRTFYFHEHLHPRYEIIIPETAGYRCLLNHERLSVDQGEMLLVQTGDQHQDLLNQGVRYDVITFSIHTLDPAGRSQLFRGSTLPGQQIFPFGQPLLAALLNEMKQEMADTSDSAYYILSGLFTSFFWKTVSIIPDRILSEHMLKNSRQMSFKNKLLEVFEDNLSRMLSVREMADQLNMSESSLAHQCKDLLSLPPRQAFMNYKLKTAKQLLAYSDRPIKNISERLGFKNPFHFSKAFKNSLNISPSQYRKDQKR